MQISLFPGLVHSHQSYNNTCCSLSQASYHGLVLMTLISIVSGYKKNKRQYGINKDFIMVPLWCVVKNYGNYMDMV